jgi:hypothetical protein
MNRNLIGASQLSHNGSRYGIGLLCFSGLPDRSDMINIDPQSYHLPSPPSHPRTK